MDATTMVIPAGAVAILAGGFVDYLLVRRRIRRQEEAVYHHFHCPGCRRRRCFQSRQVGRKGECSHCGHPVTFPPVSQSVD